VALTYCIFVLLCGIVVFAHPRLRSVKHDAFEWIHRFLGWSAVALVWPQVILLVNDYKSPQQTLRNAMAHSAAFWMVVVLTLSLALPWMRLRKVNVRSEVLSSHCVRLYFDYGNLFLPTQANQLTSYV
jgi:hypothetical protein